MTWTIQSVHYPLFAAVGDESFAASEAAHSSRITWVIGLPWAGVRRPSRSTITPA